MFVITIISSISISIIITALLLPLINSKCVQSSLSVLQQTFGNKYTPLKLLEINCVELTLFETTAVQLHFKWSPLPCFVLIT